MFFKKHWRYFSVSLIQRDDKQEKYAMGQWQYLMLIKKSNISIDPSRWRTGSSSLWAIENVSKFHFFPILFQIKADSPTESSDWIICRRINFLIWVWRVSCWCYLSTQYLSPSNKHSAIRDHCIHQHIPLFATHSTQMDTKLCLLKLSPLLFKTDAKNPVRIYIAVFSNTDKLCISFNISQSIELRQSTGM